MEPGEVLERFAREPHLFTVLPTLNTVRAEIAAFLAHPDELFLRERAAALEYLHERALHLRAESLSRLGGASDQRLRYFHLRLCGGDPSPLLGSFCHVELWSETCQAASCPDSLFDNSMAEGFPLLGN